MVEAANSDIKGDVIGGAIGTGGGTVIGAIFSHAAGGFGFGLLELPSTSCNAKAGSGIAGADRDHGAYG